jgi:dCMP deaminase
MTKEQKYNDLYMGIAEKISQMSYAKRLQVGCVIVKDDNIISFGWNGMPSGWNNECETKVYFIEPELENSYVFPHEDEVSKYRLVTKPEVLHAESNAIAKLSKSKESSESATLYCTHAPCIECSKLIFQSGIKKVFYREAYRSSEGTNFLEKSGVKVVKI